MDQSSSRFGRASRRTKPMAARAAPIPVNAVLPRLAPRNARDSPRGRKSTTPCYRPRVPGMFQNRRSRERMVKWLGIFVAVAMVLSLVLPFVLGR